VPATRALWGRGNGQGEWFQSGVFRVRCQSHGSEMFTVRAQRMSPVRSTGRYRQQPVVKPRAGWQNRAYTVAVGWKVVACQKIIYRLVRIHNADEVKGTRGVSAAARKRPGPIPPVRLSQTGNRCGVPAVCYGVSSGLPNGAPAGWRPRTEWSRHHMSVPVGCRVTRHRAGLSQTRVCAACGCGVERG